MPTHVQPADFYRHKNSYYKKSLEGFIAQFQVKRFSLHNLQSIEYKQNEEKISLFKGLLSLVTYYQSIAEAEKSEQQSLF